MLLQRLNKAERLNQLATYLYLPYQLLQIVGYRLAGKQCDYQWRRYRPEPIGPTTRTQHFVASVFPTAVCCTVLAGQIILALYLLVRYYSPQTPWLIFVVLVQPLPFSLYGALMIFDFLRLRRCAKQQKSGPE
jgi:hypothetical protein